MTTAEQSKRWKAHSTMGYLRGGCAFRLFSFRERREPVISLLCCRGRCFHTLEAVFCLTSHCLAVHFLGEAMWKMRDGLGQLSNFSKRMSQVANTGQILP